MRADPIACRAHPWRSRAVEVASVAVFLACVGAVAHHTRSLTPSRDTGSYHDAVRAAINAMPREVGEWIGVDVPIPAQAQSLLRPTAFLSRQYVNRATGENCLVTIVHCSDARDMLDHYPPNCYPGQGWALQAATPIDIELSIGTLRAVNYEFSRGRFGASTIAAVTNAMLLPNGTSDRDMGGIERAMNSADLRFYGVAQVQVFFDQAIAPARRQEIVRQMLEGHQSCITAIIRQPRLL